jgi:hypothetical protein
VEGCLPSTLLGDSTLLVRCPQIVPLCVLQNGGNLRSTRLEISGTQLVRSHCAAYTDADEASPWFECSVQSCACCHQLDLQHVAATCFLQDPDSEPAVLEVICKASKLGTNCNMQAVAYCCKC